MAAKTPTAAQVEVTMARDDQGLKHYVGYFVVGNGDTWTSGIRGIKDVWTKPSVDGEHVAATVNASTGVVTFNTSGVTRETWLMVRHK